MIKRTFAVALLANIAFVACGGDAPSPDATKASSSLPGPEMMPGENCLSCHRAGGSAARVPWTAAGTVYETADAPATAGTPQARVHIVDAQGKHVQLTTNAVGNFFTNEPLTPPLNLAVEANGKRLDMPVPLNAQGACNGCHSHPDPIGGARGRIRLR